MFQLTLILLLCCFGFAHAKTDQALPTTDNFIFSQTDIKSPAADNYFMVFKANYEHVEGNYQNAFKSYEKLLQSSPSPEMYGRYVRLLFDTKQYQEVVKMIEKTKPVAGADLDLQLIYAQSWLNLNKDDKAEELLSGLSKKFPKSQRGIDIN